MKRKINKNFSGLIFDEYPEFATGGSYTPVPVEKRNQWNDFIKYMREQGMSGSSSLDRGGNPTQKLLSQYRTVNPQFNIQPEDVSNIQYEMNQYKETGQFPGYSQEGQGALGTYKKYADRKQFSKKDAWIGSKTSQQFYPQTSTTFEQKDITGKTLSSQYQNYGANVDSFAKGEGIDWSQRPTASTQAKTMGVDGMNVAKLPDITQAAQAAVPATITTAPTGRRVKLGSQTLGTYNDGVFVPAAGLTGNAARIANDKATINEYLASNGYMQKGGSYIGNDGKRHKSKGSNWTGQAFYADGGIYSPEGQEQMQMNLSPEQQAAAMAAWSGDPNAQPTPQRPDPNNTAPPEQMQPQRPSFQERWAAGNTDLQQIGRLSNRALGVTNKAIDLVGMYSSFVSNRQDQKNNQEYLANQQSTDAMFGNNPTPINKGDYGATGSGYGTFRPNQQGNYSYKGMTDGMHYPGQAKFGAEVPEYAIGGAFESLLSPSDNVPLQSQVPSFNIPQQPEDRITPRSLPNNRSSRPNFDLGDQSPRESGNEWSGIFGNEGAKTGQPTNLNSSAIGRGQMIRGTRIAMYKKLGISDIDAAEREFKTNPDFEMKVLNAYRSELGARIPNSIQGKEREYMIAKGWYTGDPFFPDNVVPGKSAGNKMTAGQYAKRAVRGYAEGGEYEMSEQELKQFLADGGQVEFI